MTVTNLTQRCKSCDAEIVWAISEHGRRMPVDARPAYGANVRLDLRTTPPTARVVGATIDMFDPDDDGQRYFAHHYTCPDGDEWRTR